MTAEIPNGSEMPIMLTLSMLCNLACAVGIDMGFNAANIQSQFDNNTMEWKLQITWGDAATMKTSRPPGDYRVAYVEDERCIREPRSLQLSKTALYESVDALKVRFIDALLELKMEVA
jgi:hypothetical protein